MFVCHKDVNDVEARKEKKMAIIRVDFLELGADGNG